MAGSQDNLTVAMKTAGTRLPVSWTSTAPSLGGLTLSSETETASKTAPITPGRTAAKATTKTNLNETHPGEPAGNANKPPAEQTLPIHECGCNRNFAEAIPHCSRSRGSVSEAYSTLTETTSTNPGSNNRPAKVLLRPCSVLHDVVDDDAMEKVYSGCATSNGRNDGYNGKSVVQSREGGAAAVDMDSGSSKEKLSQARTRCGRHSGNANDIDNGVRCSGPKSFSGCSPGIQFIKETATTTRTMGEEMAVPTIITSSTAAAEKEPAGGVPYSGGYVSSTQKAKQAQYSSCTSPQVDEENDDEELWCCECHDYVANSVVEELMGRGQVPAGNGVLKLVSTNLESYWVDFCVQPAAEDRAGALHSCRDYAVYGLNLDVMMRLLGPATIKNNGDGERVYYDDDDDDDDDEDDDDGGDAVGYYDGCKRLKHRPSASTHELERGKRHLVRCREVNMIQINGAVVVQGIQCGSGPLLYLTTTDGTFEFFCSDEGRSSYYDFWLPTLYKMGAVVVRPLDLLQVHPIRLGQGSFGAVVPCTFWPTGKQLCLKQMRRAAVFNKLGPGQTDSFHTEAEILQSIQHPYIVKLCAAFEQEDYLYMVLEKLEGGTVWNYVHTKGVYTEAQAREAITRLLIGLLALNARGIVHRDLKPENVLLENENDPTAVRLIDFGLATYINSPRMGMHCGSPGFVAPEVIQRKPYGSNVDVFSLGVMLYVILTAVLPFKGRSKSEPVLSRNDRCDIDFMHQKLRDVSPELKHFLYWTMEPEPSRRLNVRQAFLHPWIVGHNPDSSRMSRILRTLETGRSAAALESDNYLGKTEYTSIIDEAKSLLLGIPTARKTLTAPWLVSGAHLFGPQRSSSDAGGDLDACEEFLGGVHDGLNSRRPAPLHV